MIRMFNSRHLTVEVLIGARDMEKRITDQLPSDVEKSLNSAKEHRSRVNQE
jgi:hypothetical protein